MSQDASYQRYSREEVELALEKLLHKYVRLVNCGDCGNWDPETEPEVIAARRVLGQVK